MNFKTTYTLFGILGLLLLVFFLVLWLGPTAKTQSDYVLPTANEATGPIPPGDITRVEIDRTSPRAEKLVFERDPATRRWQMTQPSGFHADDVIVDTMVGQLLRPRRGAQEPADLNKNLKEWDLDPPLAAITLHSKEDREWRINLGRQSVGTTTAVVYVSSSDRPQDPLAVLRSGIDLAFKDVNDYRSKVLLADVPADIQYIKLQQGQGKPLVLEKKSETRWVFVEPKQYGDADMGTGVPGIGSEDKQNPGVRGLLSALTGLRLDSTADFVQDHASDKDLTEKKLEPKDAVYTIEVKRTQGSDKTPQAVTLFLGSPVDSGKVYARLQDEKNVVRVPAASVEQIKKALDKPDDLRDRRLVRQDLAQPDALNITNDKGTFRLRETPAPDGWMLYRGNAPASGEATDHNVVTALTTELDRARVLDFVDADVKIDKPAVVLALWIHGLKTPEKSEPAKSGPKPEPELKTADKPDLELTFGTPERDRVVVRRRILDGGDYQTTVVKVPLAVYDALAKGPLDYLKREITPFTTAMGDVSKDVTKVTLDRGGETFEMEKETKDNVATWKFVQPSDLKGQTVSKAVLDGILHKLNNQLSVTRIAAEKPSADDLDKKYGLKSPRDKVVIQVTKEGKPEPVEYLFGGETEDKLGIFTKVGKSDFVYVVAKDVLTTLDAELQDTRLLTLDPANITGLKLVGWKKQNITPYTLELERDAAGSWTVKTPAGFPLDVSKVDALDKLLATLTAQRLIRKGSPAADDKMFDVANNALEIEIRVKGEEKPHKLVIGATAEKGGYFARLDPAGPAFVLAEEPWKKVLENQSYFAKP